ncbi:Uncharacterized protein APZ42_017518 [Daphnia magna]|uniref:Uncharacterized protein n=2 Tax=Daphnia magna TaxID=35525 RepID=A0A0P5FGD5_9CRUS|nr:hypothetical protein OUZ56_015989 [Daphnia magna]KZS16915.1 Uncharacterized protein APZ42_017518 [Daphnia magna]
MAARNALLARPQWLIANQLTMPLITVADDGKKSLRGLVVVIVQFTIFLDTLFVEKAVQGQGRSMEQDQFQIYKSIEGALQVAGMDGKACLLRTICEIQQNQIGQYTLAGEFATLLLTPKKGETGFTGFLHDYLMAEKVGRSLNQSCSDSFPRCPLSLFEYFRSYGTSSAANDAANRDEILEPSSIPEEIEPLKHSSFATRDDNGADHQMKMENDATSVRKKHPFGVGNEI